MLDYATFGEYAFRGSTAKIRCENYTVLRVSWKEPDGDFMERERFFSAKRVTTLAVLLALVVVLQAFGATVNIGPVQLNFTLIPIVLGAIVLGPLSGAILGLACGIVVFVQVVMGLVPFYVLIWSNSPVITFFTCTVKTTAAGLVAGWLFQWLNKKNRLLALFVASGAVPVVNTGLFIVGCLLMSDTIAMASGGTNVLTFILVSLVTFNFFIEFAINLLVAPSLRVVYDVVMKSFRRK